MNIIFAGTPAFAVPSLQMLLTAREQLCAVYTQPDRPSGRGRQLHPSPIKELALQHNLPVYQPLSLNAPEQWQRIEDLKPDLMIVVAYGMILPQAVLDIPRLGCLNVHGSLLPRWRGAAPIQRAIMAGDNETGITVMRIIKKLDAGDMLHKETYALSSHDTSSTVHDALAELGALGLAKVLAQLANNTLMPEPQNEDLVTYAEKITKTEAQLDWHQPTAQLINKIKGLNAWPVAQTQFHEHILRIWLAETITNPTTGLLPGTVTIDNKHIHVATGDGQLRLLEVQLPGGKKISADAFLNAHTFNGVTLG
ncbi:MAG: methionyl-tRNA formyltransferase [Methylovulum sp.]|jgi:methionyl-tRNA formyltransferase|nr:methionyl-tRNA formyltransferase [Methylovulum sp.]